MGIVIYHHPKLVSRWVDRLMLRIDMYGEYVAHQWLYDFMKFNEVDRIVINRELHKRTAVRVRPEPEND